jgi:hypothetical protein
MSLLHREELRQWSHGITCRFLAGTVVVPRFVPSLTHAKSQNVAQLAFDFPWLAFLSRAVGLE